MLHRDQRAVKIGGVTALLLTVVALRYCWLTQQQAAEWVIHGSYWILLGLLLVGAIAFGRWWRDRPRRALEHRKAFLAFAPLAALALFLQLHEPHLLKVNYDENVLVGISRTMHYEHLAAWPAAAHLTFGTVTPTAFLADKRPVFFPLLLSLLHNLTGYRVANAFMLNGVVGAMFMWGLYRLAGPYQLAHRGLLLPLLLASVPLVAQNATGGGFDLLNVTLIAGLALTLSAYLREPSARRLEWVVLVSLCLANTRYESLLYAAAPALAWIHVWRREKAMPELPWTILLAPLALLPALLSNAVFNSSDTFLQAERDTFWQVDNIPHNLTHAVYYLFDTTRGGTNSVWLAGLGSVALAASVLILRGLVRKPAGVPAESRAFMIVGSLIAINVVIALGLRWGEWDDPLVSRFSLPFWFLLGWSVLELVRHLEEEHRWRISKALTYISVAVVLLFAAADSSQARITHKLKAGTALAWSVDFIKQHDPHRSVLVLANSSIPYINEGYAAFPLDKWLMRFPKYAATVHHGLYSDVLIVLEERRNRESGEWAIFEKQEELLTRSQLERLGRFTVDPFYRITVFRVLKVEYPADALPWPGAEGPLESYERRVYELMH